MIRAIAACDDQNGIGKAGTLPWPHNKEDLKWFKSCTNNSIVVMGSKTWNDPKMPKPLPNRYNIVVSDQRLSNFETLPNVVVKRDRIVDTLKAIDKDIWVIGGSNLFSSLWHIVDEVWVSHIKGDYGCDTFMPSLSTFTIASREQYFDKNLDIRKYKR